MNNSRELKDNLLVRRFAAVGLIKKQQAGEISGEEAAMLREFMADPNVRGFVYEAINKEVAADAKIITEAYNHAKSTAASGGADPSEAAEVAKIVSTYKAIKAATGSVQPAAHRNMTAEELEVKKIVDAYNGTTPKDTDPEAQHIVDAYKGKIPKDSTPEIDELLNIHNSRKDHTRGSKE